MAPLKRGGRVGFFTPRLGVGFTVVLGQLIHSMNELHQGYAVSIGLASADQDAESRQLFWREAGVDEELTCLYGKMTDAVAKRFGEDPKDVEKMKKDPGGALESMQDAMLPVLEDIGSEIRLSFDYHENQYDQEVKEVFISGGSVLFPGIDTMLAQIFNLPVKIWDPTEGLEITSFNPGGMGGANSDMAIALGLASRLRNM